MFLFNVRVYGILINAQNQVLISDERVGDASFTKFPGGGLEYGEGIIDALKREYMEECFFDIDVVRHIYTTDFYEKSSFNESQIISVYYEVKPSYNLELDMGNKIFISPETSQQITGEKEQHFRLVPVREMSEDILTFKTDKVAWDIYVKTIKKIHF